LSCTETTSFSATANHCGKGPQTGLLRNLARSLCKGIDWIKNTFEISHTNQPTIKPMEGIRGFAVFLVFLVHYVTLIDPWLLRGSVTFRTAEYIRSIGYIGVDLFFVISGYLIYATLIKKYIPFKTYMLRRIQRIYPTFTVVLVVYIALSFVFPAESKIPVDWKEGAILIAQNYLLMPGLFDVTAIITVAWSLSYEFFYYLLIPALITLLSMRIWNSRQRILFFVSISLLLFVCFSIYGGPIALLMFVPGILLHETLEGKHIRSIPPVGLLSLFLAIVSIAAITQWDRHGWLRYAFLYVLFFIFCLECFLLSGLTNKLFSNPPLRWLGNMSYSYYLIHGLALKAIFALLSTVYPPTQEGGLIFWLFLPPVFCLTLIPSAVLFVFVEKPYSLTTKQHFSFRDRTCEGQAGL
jgi:exopolysaccharide production protein ExoZ